jgi:hypothetical protein
MRRLYGSVGGKPAWDHRAVIARTVELARASSSSTSIVLLVAFNLLPLIGVLFGRWNVATLLVLYWVENGIIGLLNVPKILLARGGVGPVEAPRVLVAVFFLIHYGLFWFVHGVFVLTLPMFIAMSGAASPVGPIDVQPTLPPGFPPDLVPAIGGGGSAVGPVGPVGPDLSAVAIAAIGLAISHTVSLVVNYLGRGENLKVSPAQQAQAPYGRLVILHVTIIIGAMVSLFIGSPVGAVVVLVLLKTIVDLRFHLREHAAIAARPHPA